MIKASEFNEVIKRQMDRSAQMLDEKGEEYASSSDRLRNFRVSAELQNIPMHEALGGMMAKHTASIYNMLQGHVDTYSRHQWDEKITDHINYLLILQAVLFEERSATADKIETDIKTSEQDI